MVNPVSKHIDKAIANLPTPQFRAVCAGIGDLLAEVRDEAAQDNSPRVLLKIEKIAKELGITIAHINQEEK